MLKNNINNDIIGIHNIRSGEIMLKKPILIIMSFLVFFSVSLYAQTAAELDKMLQTDVVTCAQASRFVLAGASNDASAGKTLTAQAAFETAAANNWLKGVNPEDPITLGKLSYLVMKAFELKGGLMYAIFPGPRYAYRSLSNRFWIQGTSDPAMTIDGQGFLLILGKVLSSQGGEE